MGRADDLFHSIQVNGITAIEQFIVDRRSEELFLDFKRSADDGNMKNLHVNDLNNYGKAISGFGNSSGGVIVWGIDCSDLGDGADVARAKKPIEDPQRFVSWLEKKTSGRTLPPHSEVIHHIIEIPGSTKGVIATLIPKSDCAPHQENNSKCYYMRVGSNFEPVPHGILEGFFGRRIQAKIVHTYLYSGITQKRDGEINLELGIALRNEGKGIARHAFLTADIEESPTTAVISLRPPSQEHWISQFFIKRSFSAIAREGIVVPLKGGLVPLTVIITLNRKIDHGLSIKCCCGSENSQPVFFELGCSKEVLQECCDNIFNKIEKRSLTKNDADQAAFTILGLHQEKAIGNSILRD